MKTAVAKRIRWTVKDYFRMSEAGLLHDRRAELLNGDLLKMPAQATPHRVAISKTSALLFGALGATHWVVSQGTLILSKHDAPDPDFHIFDAPMGTPDNRLPLPVLVIEISDSTYRKDSGPKLRTYARAGILDYWIFNLPQDRIEIYRQPENPTLTPSGWRYASVDFRHHGDHLTPLMCPQHSFAVDAMLP
jgi:Uma2 family endonuclease